MFSHSSASKNARAWQSWSKTRVREVSTCRIDSSHQYPASRSASSSGSGIRAIHRSNHTCTVPGPNRSQICWRAAGILAGGEPVGQRGEPDPGRGRLPLGPLVSVDPHLDRIREIGADLDEPGAHLLIEDVHVEHRDPPLLLGEGELRAPARIGVPLARGPHQLELLGAADRRRPASAPPRGSFQVRGQHVGLALPGREPDHRDAVGPRPVPDVLPELLPDRLEQRRATRSAYPGDRGRSTPPRQESAACSHSRSDTAGPGTRHPA